MDIFNLHYTCALLEREGVDLADREVLYSLVGVREFHAHYAELDDDARIQQLLDKPFEDELLRMVHLFEREPLPRERRAIRRHNRYKKGMWRLLANPLRLDFDIEFVRRGSYDEEGRYIGRLERPMYPGNVADALYGCTGERYNEWNGSCGCWMCRNDRHNKYSAKWRLTRKELLMLRLERLGDPMVKGEE